MAEPHVIHLNPEYGDSEHHGPCPDTPHHAEPHVVHVHPDGGTTDHYGPCDHDHHTDAGHSDAATHHPDAGVHH